MKEPGFSLSVFCLSLPAQRVWLRRSKSCADLLLPRRGTNEVASQSYNSTRRFGFSRCKVFAIRLDILLCLDI
jgi:hypothetical protein